MTAPVHPRKIRAQRAFRLKVLTLALLIIALGYLVYWYSDVSGWVITNDAYITGNVITVKAQVTGIVKAIHVDNTQQVEAGDVLVTLDGVAARLAWNQAQAELADTVRRVSALYSATHVIRRRIAAQTASLDRVRHDLQRYRMAVKDEAVSIQQAQNAQDLERELRAQIRQSEAELEGADAQVRNTTVNNHPAIVKAANAARRAYLELVRQSIVAPVSGVVAKRKVQTGDSVQPGTPLLAIVPLDHLWVEANLKETEIVRVQPGQTARIAVDAYAGEDAVYAGKVVGLHPGTGSLFALLPPENAGGNYIHVVERLPVRIEIDANQLRARPLRPGLSTITRIDVSSTDRQTARAPALTAAPSYKTAVYDRELEQAEQQIAAIIKQNASVAP